jgi:hypothetical protein
VIPRRPATTSSACSSPAPRRPPQQILNAVRRDRRRALIGPDAKVVDLVSRLPARLYQTVLEKGAKKLRH